MSSRQSYADGVLRDPLTESMLGSTRIGIWVWNVTADAVRCSLWLARILDCSLEALGKDMFSMRSHVYPADADKVGRHTDHCLWGAAGWHEECFRWLKKDGNVVWTRELCTVTDRSDDGIPLSVCGILNPVDPHEAKAINPAVRNRVPEAMYKEDSSGIESWQWDFAENYLSDWQMR